MKKNRFLVGMVSLSIAAILFTGCGGSKYETTANQKADRGVMYSAPEAASMEFGYDTSYAYESPSVKYEGGSNSSASEVTGSMTSTADIERKLIKTGCLSLQTLEFDKYLDYLESEVKAKGGYIESQEAYGTTNYRNYRTATYVIRVPQSQFDFFMDNICEYATLVNKSQNSKDITENYVDTKAHIKTLEIEQERLLALLEKADSVETIIALEQRLSEVRYSLEYYQSLIRNYDSLVSYSTITINVAEVETITVPEPETWGSRIADRFSDSVSSVVEGFKDFIVWLFGDIIFIVFWVAILSAAFVGTRKYIRKKKNVKKDKEQNTVSDNKEE